MDYAILLYIGKIPFLTLVLWTIYALVLAALVLVLLKVWGVNRKLRLSLMDMNDVSKPNVSYDLVLQSMNLSTWTIDAKTHAVTYERDYRKGLNYHTPQKGVDVFRDAEAIVPEDMDRIKVSLAEICEGKKDYYHEEYRAQRQGGGIYWAESFAVVASRDESGNPEMIAGTSMVIDERKKLEKALVEAYDKAEESNRLKTSFLANISHEIRTPLNLITGYAEILTSTEDNDMRKLCISTINENVPALLHLVGDMLRLSEMEAGEIRLIKSNVDLHLLLKHVYDNCLFANNKNDIAIHLVEPDNNYIVSTDRDALFRIMTHYVSNALKFTEHGHIDIGYECCDDGHIHFFVRDTGKGISESDKKRIFERFFKVNEFVQGTGLGLYLCRTMAYAIGGSVGVDSELGKGSTFWLDMPHGVLYDTVI